MKKILFLMKKRKLFGFNGITNYKKMRPILFCNIFILLMAALTLTGCLQSDGEKKQVQKSNPELATEHQTIIVDSLINRDKEGIKRVLCPYVTKRMKDIDEQIEKAFDFFDGDVICYDEPSSSGGIGSWDKEFYGTDTRHVITDKGTEYFIVFGGWFTNVEEPDKIGVNYIRISNCTASKETELYSIERELCSIYIGDSSMETGK